MHRSRGSIVAFAAMVATACGGGGGGGGGGGPTDPGPVRPSVSTVTPDPVPAGEPITIDGQNLVSRAPAGGLTAAATSVQLGSTSLSIQSETSTRLQARVPIDLRPGTYDLTVTRNGTRSDPHALEVELFDLTGSYGGVLPLTRSTCATAPPGTRQATLAVVDNRPTFSATLDGVPLTFTATPEPVSTPPGFRISGSGTVGDETATVEGRIFHGPHSNRNVATWIVADLVLEPADGSCFSEYRFAHPVN